MEVPPNGWFIVENAIKMDNFGGSPISGNLHISTYKWNCPLKYETFTIPGRSK
jgi:hypothetical protein